MAKATILLAEDDESTRDYLATLLASRSYEVWAVESGEQALARLDSGAAPDLVLLDLIMPGMGGLEILDLIRRSRPTLPVIILSTVAQLKTVVDAVKRGASDYLTKPFQEEELELTIVNALEKQRLREEVRSLKQKLDQSVERDFVSSNPLMLKIKEIALQVADTDAPVLLLGESGVGKEVLARFIHAQSNRRDKPLVRVNCAALPQELLESELFGYERGAFSGALSEKPGRFELAGKGTILLDEIGEMSPHLQAKLLHVLQDGEYSRLGGRHSMRAEARVLASTNSLLDEAVAANRFREDLFFRLNVIRIEIPALRERREEIPLLSSHFLERYASKYKRSQPELPRELMDAFLRHDWPGNIRELENAVRRFVILPDLGMALQDLRRPLPGAASEAERPLAVPRTAPEDVSLKRVSARAAHEAERELLRRVLTETKWNRREAARRLKISYKALLNKIKRWENELEPNQSLEGASEIPRAQ
jgi:two-component system response regulator AtoC